VTEPESGRFPGVSNPRRRTL